MIHVRRVSKRFGVVQALYQVTLQIHEGVFGLLGPNGAGKTTLMRILATYFPPDEGEIEIFNLSPSRNRQDIRRIIGYLPQEFRAYERLTGWEFLEYMALLKEIPSPERRKRITQAAQMAGLEPFASRKIREYSGGMMRRLGLAQALLNDPQILLLDEPTSGLDPEERLRIQQKLVELGEQGRVILLATHLVEDVQRCCSQVGVLHQGQVLFQGKVAQLLTQANGHVFEAEIQPPIEAWADRDPHIRVTYVQPLNREDSTSLRVRFLVLQGGCAPKEARPVSPTLEEAYLFLLGSKSASIPSP